MIPNLSSAVVGCVVVGVLASWPVVATNEKRTSSRLRHPSLRQVISGTGEWLYEYDPSRLSIPPRASMVNGHGFGLDADANIYLTYETNHHKKEEDLAGNDHCLLQWTPDGLSPRFVNTSSNVCAGTPHGLTLSTEGFVEYMYHANNDQRLTKTFLNGTMVWQTLGLIDGSSSEYRPTWMAVPPHGPYIYLCDGYGSNFVYLMDRQSGHYLKQKWGGRGEAHGQFATNHGCVYDPVHDQIVVADREHGRLEYYDYYHHAENNNNNNINNNTYGVFSYSHSTDMRHGPSTPGYHEDSRPCILRRQPQQSDLAAVPDLTGTVQILDEHNTVVSIVNVSGALGHLGHLHPHDAQILPNGDLIVATWNPGRVSYWKRISKDDEKNWQSAMLR